MKQVSSSMPRKQLHLKQPGGEAHMLARIDNERNPGRSRWAEKSGERPLSNVSTDLVGSATSQARG